MMYNSTELEVMLLIIIWLMTLTGSYLVGRYHGEHVGYVSGLCDHLRRLELEDDD